MRDPAVNEERSIDRKETGIEQSDGVDPLAQSVAK